MKKLLVIMLIFLNISSFAQNTSKNIDVYGISLSNSLNVFRSKINALGYNFEEGKRGCDLTFAGIEDVKLLVNPYSRDSNIIHHIEIIFPTSILNVTNIRNIVEMYQTKYGDYTRTITNQFTLYEWKIKGGIGYVSIKYTPDDRTYDHSIVVNYYDFTNARKYYSSLDAYKNI